MSYRPKILYRFTVPIVAACFLSAVFLLIFGLGISGSPGVYYKAGAAALAVLSIQLTNRLLLTGMLYQLDGGSFRVYRIQGKVSKLAADISLRNALGVVGYSQRKKIGKIFGKIHLHASFTQNMYSRDMYYFVFENDGRKACVSFEADREFISVFKALMPPKEV